MAQSFDATRVLSADQERSHRLADGLRQYALDLDRQVGADALGRIAARWTSVLLEGSLGAIAWRTHSTADWQIEAVLKGSPVPAEQPEYAVIRALVEKADLQAGLDPVWVSAGRGSDWSAGGSRIKLEQWGAARTGHSDQLCAWTIVGRARRRFGPFDEITLLTINQLFLRHLERRHQLNAVTETRLAQAGWEALSQAAVELGGYTDLDSVLNAVVRQSQEISQCEVSLFFLKDPATDDLVLRAFAGIRSPEFGHWTGQDLPSGFRRPFSQGFIGIAIRERRPVVLPEIKLEEQPHPTQLALDLQLHSAINTPVFSNHEILGAITVGNRSPGRFRPQLTDVLVVLGRLAAAAITNVQLHEQSRESIRDLQADQKVAQTQHSRLEQTLAVQAQLADSVTNGADLDKVVQTLANAIGRPVQIHDAAFRLRTMAGPQDAIESTSAFDGGDDEPSRELIRLDEPRVRQRLDELMSDMSSANLATGSPPLILESNVVAPILFGKAILGYLSTRQPAAAGNDLDLVAINQAAMILALQMLGERRAAEVTDTFRSEFFWNLLMGSDLSTAELIARAQYLGHQPADRHAVIVVQVDSTADPVRRADNPLLLAELRRLAESLTGPILSVSRPRTAILLIPLRPDAGIESVRSFAQRLASQAQERWPATTLLIGIGSVAPTMSDVKQSFENAQLALQGLWAQGASAAGRILAWDDLGIVSLLLQASGAPPLGNHVRQFLGRLLDYDRTHGSALVETLREYFVQGSNLEGTARALHLHPHSLRYRLQRASEIAGLDLKDPDCRLNVQLALKIVDLDRSSRLGSEIK